VPASTHATGTHGGIAGRQYLLHGRLVTVTEAWNGTQRDLPSPLPRLRTKRHSPRNVQVLLPDGTLTIRRFRGLLRVRTDSTSQETR
jgi:hypothetical protein